MFQTLALNVETARESNKGVGVWIDRWGTTIQGMKDDKGNTVQKNTPITLSILGEAPKDSVTYALNLN